MKKIKNRNTLKNTQRISFKILRLTVIAVAVTAAISSTIALISLYITVEETAQNGAQASISMMEGEIANLKTTMENAAKMIAAEDETVQAVRDSSRVQALLELQKMAKVLEVDTVTLTDINGIVIARLHEPGTYGDSMADQSTVKSALAGKTNSQIEYDTTIHYAVKSATPVVNSVNSVIGVVIVSYKLETPEFLDNIQEIMDAEFSIFAGDERINTTIMENGARILGTKLSAKIADQVINQQKTYVGKTTLAGKNYIAIYAPIFSADGSSVSGALATATDLTSTENAIRTDIIIIVLVGLVAVAVTIVLGITSLRRIVTKPLEKVVRAAQAIAAGEMNENVSNDLNSIAANDEIGELARSMERAVESIERIADDAGMLADAVTNHDLTVTIDTEKHAGMYKTVIEIVETLFAEIHKILQEIQFAADGIGVGADQVSYVSQTLAQGATEQASSTQELAATIEEIALQIKGSAESAGSASALAEEAGRGVTESSSSMDEMLAAMKDISATSGEIGKIIKTIDDIAFQTNILALNAAVEAARAGAAGKGFGVVADEVRNLATKSAEAAKSTTLLIESSLDAVDKGGKIAGDTALALKLVVEKVNRVNATVHEITEAAQKQSDGIYQINVGVSQISDVVQTNSATAEESAAASEELSGQAQTMMDMVNRYKLKS